LVWHCPLIQTLDLSETPVTDDAIRAVADRLFSLVSLPLTKCVRLTNFSIVYLLKTCKTLVTLVLTDIPTITNDAMIGALEETESLRSLAITGTQCEKDVLERSLPSSRLANLEILQKTSRLQLKRRKAKEKKEQEAMADQQE